MPVLLSSHDRESELFARYLENYDRIAADDLAAPIQEARVQEFFNERLFSYLGDVAGLRVCDVGVGRGMLFDKLRQSAPVALVGVDISVPYLMPFARDRESTVVLANAENLPFRDAFDLVVAADVLEHVLNIGDLLMSVRESLVSGGRFVVRVPYLDNMLQYARQAGCRYDAVHLRNFSRGNLVHLLRHTGFVVERLRLRRVQQVARAPLSRGYGSRHAAVGRVRRASPPAARSVSSGSIPTSEACSWSPLS